jgi:hypothetical protein
MILSSTSFRHIFFNNIEKLIFDLNDDKAQDSCNCRCDDKTRDETFNN